MSDVVEQYTIRPIPDTQRFGTARGLFPFWFTANSSAFTIVLGAIGIELGLGLVPTILAIVAGGGGGGGFVGVHSRSGARARPDPARPEPGPVRVLRRAAAERPDLADLPRLHRGGERAGRPGHGRPLAPQLRRGDGDRLLRDLAGGVLRLPDHARRQPGRRRGRTDPLRGFAGPAAPA